MERTDAQKLRHTVDERQNREIRQLREDNERLAIACQAQGFVRDYSDRLISLQQMVEGIGKLSNIPAPTLALSTTA